MSPASTAPGREAALASLLGRLDSWMGATHYGVDHPWRIAIAEGLGAASVPAQAHRGATVPQGNDDPRLAAVAAICEQLGYALLDTLSVLYATDADDSPAVRVAAAGLERAGWLAERASLLAGGTRVVEHGADSWFLSPVTLDRVGAANRLREGGAA